eukprot:TRINITY_DN35122_c0_g1_i1.p1 TRINITY_DN35122_c0_g1~~TRINITY_DN35122_c0_g1_i1.p1  ORF type:complete len:261 (+),score=19.44 TRINITY_DN35122_c0_g1_i1:54-785(+)
MVLIVSRLVFTAFLLHGFVSLFRAARVPLDDENDKDVSECLYKSNELLENIEREKLPTLERLIAQGRKMVEKEGLRPGGRTERFTTAINHLWPEFNKAAEYVREGYKHLESLKSSGQEFDLKAAQFYIGYAQTLTDVKQAGGYFKELVDLDDENLSKPSRLGFSHYKTLDKKVAKLFKDDPGGKTTIFNMRSDIQRIRKTPIDVAVWLGAFTKHCAAVATAEASQSLQEMKENVFEANDKIFN